MKSSMELHAESTYSLPLALLLQILEGHGQTCQLWAEVPPGRLSAQGALHTICQAELVVVQGKVHTCLLRESETGHVLLEGRNAFEQLIRSGQLQWHVRPDVLSPSAARASPISPTTVPGEALQAQRVDPLPSGQIETLERRHRQVLLLADGQRDIETLARMTHCSAEQIDVILRDLAAWHLIRFAPADDGRKS
jgi:hypothetical protein